MLTVNTPSSTDTRTVVPGALCMNAFFRRLETSMEDSCSFISTSRRPSALTSASTPLCPYISISVWTDSRTEAQISTFTLSMNCPLSILVIRSNVRLSLDIPWRVRLIFTSSSAWLPVRFSESRSISIRPEHTARGVWSSCEAFPMNWFWSSYCRSNLSAACWVARARVRNSVMVVSQGTGGLFFPGVYVFIHFRRALTGLKL